jgi:superfamily II DNA/RNA helicase
VRDLNKMLQRDGFNSGEIHGDMDQSSRIAELDRFKSGAVNILVASDVAARGLDVKGVSHVFNYDTPWHPDDYVHRIGRTGRAGAKGRAFTLVTAEDAEAVANVEKLTGGAIPVYDMGGGDTEQAAPAAKPARSRKAKAAPAADAEVETEAPPVAEKPARRSRKRAGEEPRSSVSAEPVAEVEAETETRAAPRREARVTPHREPPKRDYRKSAPAEVSPPGEWNGPVPGFLGFSAL